MKKFFKTISLALAFSFLGLAPLAACENRENVDESNLLEKLPGITVPDEKEFPVVGNEDPTVETPQTPEDPPVETPQTPENPTVEIPSQNPPVPAKAQYVRALVSNLNVRTGAGTGYKSLGQIEKGVLLDLKGKSGDWYETVFCGQRAFVSASKNLTALSELDLAAEKIEAVISEGLKYMGVPYVYGATRYHDGKGNLLRGFTASKFDCSSLMQYVFYLGAGVKLDVTTRTQIKQGTAVAKGNIRRGDLLFFTNASRFYNTGIERVGHVALYLGDNYILHTASDYAKVEQISGKRWSYFLEARRVL